MSELRPRGGTGKPYTVNNPAPNLSLEVIMRNRCKGKKKGGKK